MFYKNISKGSNPNKVNNFNKGSNLNKGSTFNKARALANALLTSVIALPQIITAGVVLIGIDNCESTERKINFSRQDILEYPTPLRDILSYLVSNNIAKASKHFIDNTYQIKGQYWALSDKYKQSIKAEKDLLTSAMLASEDEHERFVNRFTNRVEEAFKQSNFKTILALINGFNVYESVYIARNSSTFKYLQYCLYEDGCNKLFNNVISNLKNILTGMNIENRSCWSYLSSSIEQLNVREDIEHYIKHDYDCYLKQFNVIYGRGTNSIDLLDDSVFEKLNNELSEGFAIKEILGNVEFEKFLKNAGIYNGFGDETIYSFSSHLFPIMSGFYISDREATIKYEAYVGSKDDENDSIETEETEVKKISTDVFLGIFKKICNKFNRAELSPVGGGLVENHKLNVKEYAMFLRHAVLFIHDSNYKPEVNRYNLTGEPMPYKGDLSSKMAFSMNKEFIRSLIPEVKSENENVNPKHQNINSESNTSNIKNETFENTTNIADIISRNNKITVKGAAEREKQEQNRKPFYHDFLTKDGYGTNKDYVEFEITRGKLGQKEIVGDNWIYQALREHIESRIVCNCEIDDKEEFERACKDISDGNFNFETGRADNLKSHKKCKHDFLHYDIEEDFKGVETYKNIINDILFKFLREKNKAAREFYFPLYSSCTIEEIDELIKVLESYYNEHYDEINKNKK